MKNKHVLMVMPVMKGGGAERVAALLMNEFYKNGCHIEFLLTSSDKNEVIRNELSEEIPLTLLQDKVDKGRSIKAKVLKVYSSFFCRIFDRFSKTVPSHFAYVSFVAQYGKEIQAIRKMLEEDSEMTVIAFLQPSIPMVMMAAKGLPNKVIFSERGNPERLMKHRYGKRFIEKYYARADVVVFQTEFAKKAYPEIIAQKGIVISNPIKKDIPLPYKGERNKIITTFCRISPEKNLQMLVESFALLQKEYEEYKLRIIGDTLNKQCESIKEMLVLRIKELGIEEKVEFLPFNNSVHQLILKDAMYINTSNYEGMSNAMLEALALGMPVICTDCPIGGARVTVQDGENGFLVPVNGINELYERMKFIIENPEKALEISDNAAKIRETMGIENISRQWMELI